MECDCLGRPSAHQAMGDSGFILIHCFGQGAGHQFLTNPDAETACQQLVEQKPFGWFKLRPRLKNTLFPLFLLQRCQLS